MDAFSTLYNNIGSFVTDNPLLRLTQGGVVLLLLILLFLLFWTLRDVLLRTRSFALQFASVLLVAALPLIGFLLYLLIRPSRTLKERETDDMLRRLLDDKGIIAPEPTATQESLPLETPSTTDL